MASAPLLDILRRLQGQPVRPPLVDAMAQYQVQYPGLVGAQISPARRYPGEFMPGEATAKDVQSALGGIIEAAGMAVVPGIGPQRLERQMPGARRRPSEQAELIRQLRSDPNLSNEEVLQIKDMIRAMTPTRRERRTNDHVNWAQVDSFPVTSEAKLAGYIRPDGALLDMSGGSGGRAYDHRQVGGQAAMEELIGKHGFVRYSPEGNTFDIRSEPSPQQLTQIKNLVQQARGEVVLDLGRGLGKYDRRNDSYGDPPKQQYLEFNRGTDPMVVMDSILSFFQD